MRQFAGPGCARAARVHSAPAARSHVRSTSTRLNKVFMLLQFDPEFRIYVGAQVAIAADVFDEALAELIAGGADAEEARLLLLDEEQWLEDGNELNCPRCGEALLPGMRFCDAGCEAAFIAA